MKIRTIAVGLMTAKEAEWLVPAACAIARRSGAHLIGLNPVEPYVPYVGMEGSIAGLAAPMFHDWQIEETAAIREIFENCTRVEEFVSEWRPQEIGITGAEGFLLDSVRGADLVILGQNDPEVGRYDQPGLQEQVIRQSGRPVLMIPRGFKVDTIGQHLMIGWSNTREATRAAHDALALAADGAEVDILFVGSMASAEDTGAACRRDLAAALDRHGFKTSLHGREVQAATVGETLMQVAFERGADLIVSGAFGHSRVYDFVIGAVTRQLLEKAQVPVLFSK